jgi:hypothetical protein
MEAGSLKTQDRENSTVRLAICTIQQIKGEDNLGELGADGADYIEMDLKEVPCEVSHWVEPPRERAHYTKDMLLIFNIHHFAVMQLQIMLSL